MRVNISIVLFGVLGIAGLLFLLSFFSAETGNGWAVNFSILGFVVVILFFLFGRRRGGD